MISYKLLFFLPLISTIFTFPLGILLGSKTAQYLSSGLISLSAIISWILFVNFYNSGSNEMIIPILDWLLFSGQFVRPSTREILPKDMFREKMTEGYG